jgi:uncharacterized SAM-binding protein YcdF (DUF218 family)
MVLSVIAERRKRRDLISWLILFMAMTTVAYFGGPTLLRQLARWWVVSDELSPADLIVVLGGGLDLRPTAAADLYKKGFAKTIAVGTSEFDGGREAKLARDILINQGVPTDAIIEFPFHPHSTYGEARGLSKWSTINRIKTVIVPTDVFPTRRAQWIFKRELASHDIRVLVKAVTPQGYDENDWWRHHTGRIQFRNELIKYTYYLLRYFWE